MDNSNGKTPNSQCNICYKRIGNEHYLCTCGTLDIFTTHKLSWFLEKLGFLEREIENDEIIQKFLINPIRNAYLGLQGLFDGKDSDREGHKLVLHLDSQVDRFDTSAVALVIRALRSSENLGYDLELCPSKKALRTLELEKLEWPFKKKDPREYLPIFQEFCPRDQH
jgi:hypothetical protein